MSIEVTDDMRANCHDLLSRIYGKSNVATVSQEDWDMHRDSLPKIEWSDEPEFSEPEIEQVQCSRCLHKQMADISRSIAITCHQCGETDAAYLKQDFVEIWL